MRQQSKESDAMHRANMIRAWLEHINDVMDGVTLRDKRNKYKRQR